MAIPTEESGESPKEKLQRLREWGYATLEAQGYQNQSLEVAQVPEPEVDTQAKFTPKIRQERGFIKLRRHHRELALASPYPLVDGEILYFRFLAEKVALWTEHGESSKLLVHQTEEGKYDLPGGAYDYFSDRLRGGHKAEAIYQKWEERKSEIAKLSFTPLEKAWIEIGFPVDAKMKIAWASSVDIIIDGNKSSAPLFKGLGKIPFRILTYEGTIKKPQRLLKYLRNPQLIPNQNFIKEIRKRGYKTQGCSPARAQALQQFGHVSPEPGQFRFLTKEELKHIDRGDMSEALFNYLTTKGKKR